MGGIAMQKMGKASKWIRNLLGGKKDEEEEKYRTIKDAAGPFSAENLATPASNILPAATPKEKQRWSLRRSATSDTSSRNNSKRSFDSAMAKASQLQITTTAFPVAAPDPIKTILAAKPALSAPGPVEHAAATKIQSIFRSYLARRALCALRALVKLQALARGYLVRKGTTATLRSMQALIAIQVRARVHRVQMAGAQTQLHPKRPTTLREVINRGIHNQHKQAYVKIKDVICNDSRADSKSRCGHTDDHPQIERTEHGMAHYSGRLSISKREHQLQTSPNPSASSETSSRTLNTQSRDSLSVQRSSRHNSPKEKTNQKRAPLGIPFPDYADQLAHQYPWLPNYMANTQSSRAKVRSQSEPKQRPESSEKRRDRRSTSDEQIDIDIHAQRSSPQVKSHAQKNQYPWLIKLYHRSTKKAIQDSDCDSISARTTNTSNKHNTIIASEVTKGWGTSGEYYTSWSSCA